MSVPSSTRVSLLSWLLLSLVCAAVAGWLGAKTIPRLSNHDGYHLIEVVDPVEVEPAVRPRRVTLVVVDGLRGDVARRMDTVATLGAQGQCRESDVGPYTVSRPVYALLSTGLEVDRSGARNNRETAPLAAESVWDVAAQAGVRVGFVSHLPWWAQLFPTAVTHAVERPEGDDLFAIAADLSTELTVIHPVYVDTAGHAHGAASAQYRDAAARVDAEATAWLRTVDLEHELVIFTADHGHTDAGGHGGPQPEIERVLVCFAGPGIARRSDAPPLDARLIAPAIAMSMGLRFPRHMRAVEDRLDDLFSVFDAEAVSARTIEDRRRSIEVFRRRNAEILAQRLGPGAEPLHSSLVSAGHRSRWPTVGVVVALWLGGVGLGIRVRRLSARRALASLAWMAGAFGLAAAVWVLWRGSFDYTSINERGPFLRNSLLVCGGTAILAAWVHRWWRSDEAGWAADQAMLSAATAGLMVGHVVVYGWPLGFPLPHRMVLFFPFFAATFGVVHGLLGAAASAWLMLRARRRQGSIATL